jgi:hypothetical protein
MKKISALFLSLFITNAFACPCPDLYKDPVPQQKSLVNKDESKVMEPSFRYKDFMSSKNKREFLDKQINVHPEIKTILGQDECKVTSYKQLRQNSAILFLQVGCKGMKDNIHIVLPKVDVIDAKVNTCEGATKKFGSYVVCKGKI